MWKDDISSKYYISMADKNIRTVVKRAGALLAIILCVLSSMDIFTFKKIIYAMLLFVIIYAILRITNKGYYIKCKCEVIFEQQKMKLKYSKWKKEIIIPYNTIETARYVRKSNRFELRGIDVKSGIPVEQHLYMCDNKDSTIIDMFIYFTGKRVELYS